MAEVKATHSSESRGGAGDERQELSRLASWTALVALVLFALQRSLRLPSGSGVEDWLGWSNRPSLETLVAVWCGEHFSWPAAAAYLLIDQGLFVPLYAALALTLSLRLRRAMTAGVAPLGAWMRWLLGPGMAAVVLVLVVVDTLENLGGAGRLGMPDWIFFVAALGGLGSGIALAQWLWPGVMRWPDPLSRWRWAGLVLLAIGLSLGLAWPALSACPGAIEVTARFTWAHAAKGWLIDAVLILGIMGWGVWWFGGEFDPDRQEQATLRDERATFRGLAAAVIGRSRYVLAVIGTFGALTLALDQCRDVLLALVQVQGSDARTMAQRITLLALGALAAGLLAHSCWLWTRLAGMVKRSGLSVPAAMQNDVGLFAQGWARALALVPLAMVCVLVAMTMGDLVLASRQASDLGPAVTSALLLVAFAALTLFIAGLLIRERRRLSLGSASLYYNVEPEVHQLLWFESQHLKRPAELQRHPSRAMHALTFITRPWLLPVVGLLGMALVRALASIAPDAMAATPATLLVVMFALTWWLGVLGAISLWEQHDAFPWIVLPLAVAGALSAFELTDNHAIGWQLAEGVLQLDDLRGDGRTAVLALVLAGIAAWFACVLQPARWPWKAWPRASRWAAGLGGLVVAYVALLWLDGRAGRAAEPTAACRALSKGERVDPMDCPAPSSEPLQQVLGRWLAESGLTSGKIFLVAAEGGGIRSAYWTAQALARMHGDPGYRDFDRRVVLLSGVSGGSMGHVAYLACVRLLRQRSQEPSATALHECIDSRFARMDALTPLLGGLLFEDVFSRVLPLSRGPGWWRCNHPGCGQVNRAEAFEREWIAAFAEGAQQPLASGLLTRRPGEPTLALNSTWVETGNRTVAVNARLHAESLPAAAQLTRCLGSDVRLVTAAHTSARFPITNPLAGVQPLGRADDACISGGHLIDGGYFDNSAVPTLLDVRRALLPLLEGKGLEPVYLLIRNGQKPQSCEVARKTGPDPACIRLDPRQRPEPADLDMPSDQGRLTLYADVLGPALGLLNVSGVGSHGRESPATLRAALGETGKPCSASNVWLIDQVDDGSLVPLGWYLSPAARAAMMAQVEKRVPGECRAVAAR